MANSGLHIQFSGDAAEVLREVERINDAQKEVVQTTEEVARASEMVTDAVADNAQQQTDEIEQVEDTVGQLVDRLKLLRGHFEERFDSSFDEIEQDLDGLDEQLDEIDRKQEEAFGEESRRRMQEWEKRVDKATDVARQGFDILQEEIQRTIDREKDIVELDRGLQQVNNDLAAVSGDSFEENIKRADAAAQVTGTGLKESREQLSEAIRLGIDDSFEKLLAVRAVATTNEKAKLDSDDDDEVRAAANQLINSEVVRERLGRLMETPEFELRRQVVSEQIDQLENAGAASESEAMRSRMRTANRNNPTTPADFFVRNIPGSRFGSADELAAETANAAGAPGIRNLITNFQMILNRQNIGNQEQIEQQRETNRLLNEFVNSKPLSKPDRDE